MVASQNLDRRITLQRDGEIIGYNAFNEPIYSDPISVTLWARRRDVSDGEKFAAGQTGSFLRSRFLVRSSITTRAITPVYELIHDAALWNIIGVKEADQGRHHFIEITAIRNAD